MTEQLPFDAVVFEPGTLTDPATPGVLAPGAGRLLAALDHLGIPYALLAPTGSTEPWPPASPVADLTGDHADAASPEPASAARTARRPADSADESAPSLPGPPTGTTAGDTAASPEIGIEVAGTVGGTGVAGEVPALRTAPVGRTLVVAAGAGPAGVQVLGALAGGIGPFAAAAQLVAPLDEAAVAAATERHRSLTKPPGSLGRLEALGIQLAGISGHAVPPVPRPAAVAVFAADHGVHAQGVSPWPQEVTTQMVANFVAGGAAINVLARQAGADVVVVDVGVAGDLPPSEGLIDRKIARGTADLSTGPAMTGDQARAALDAGAEVAAELVAAGYRCLLTGDMGIANTTASAALIAALADRPAGEITGRGAGLPETEVPRKAAVVAAAATRARDHHGDDALATLAEVGGFEHAALAGYVVAGAALGVPVVVDGVIAAAALLVASRLVPGVEASTIAGHRSVEPGSAAVLDALRLAPVLDLELRLGEGTGAALAHPIVEAAARVLREMATFDQAGVSSKDP